MSYPSMLPIRQPHHTVPDPGAHLPWSADPNQDPALQGHLPRQGLAGLFPPSPATAMASGPGPRYSWNTGASQRPSPAAQPRQNYPYFPSHLVNDNEDHQLRRKTPNGTIAAGYDGSLRQLESRPPPLKQVAFTGSVTAQPFDGMSPDEERSATTPSSLPVRWPSSRHFGQDQPVRGRREGGFHPAMGMMMMPPDPGSQGQIALDFAPNPPSASFPPQTFGMLNSAAAQFAPPFARPDFAMYNNPNEGFMPGPAMQESNIPCISPITHPGMPNYYMHNYYPTFHMHPNRPLPGALYHSHPGSSHDLNSVRFPAPPSKRMESLSLNTPQYGKVPTERVNEGSLSDRRDKALADAYQVYLDFLAHHHPSKKSSHGRVASSGKLPTKLFLLPKLPKSSGSSNLSFSQRQARDRSVQGSPSASNNLGPSRRPIAQSSPTFEQGISRSEFRFADSGTPQFNQSVHPGPDPSVPRFNVGLNGLLQTPLTAVKDAIDIITELNKQSSWEWIDGLLLGGCLHYSLEHYETALDWFWRIVSLSPDHVEAISNVAASLLCLNRQQEAEQHWRSAIRKCPSHLEAVEHLVGLLCTSQRSQEAVDIINFVQTSIRQSPCDPRTSTAQPSHGASISPIADGVDRSRSLLGTASGYPFPEHASQPGFGSSGYGVPGSENGRIIALIHAKGNMLYSLKNIDGASEAFEEAVLVSAGREASGMHDIRSLIDRVQFVLAADVHGHVPASYARNRSHEPLLLPPDKAKETARLVFTDEGQLPGLRFVEESTAKKSAISTTSNSLLSLAKIFQDAMSNGGYTPKLLGHPCGVGDVLALYYLSLSLSESPSTANNVGILLASVQQVAIPSTQTTQTMGHPPIRGIIPGSGLSLALSYYHYGLSLDNKHVHLHTNLGSLLKDVGHLDMAIKMYEQAVSCDGTFDIALTNLANAVKDRGHITEAISYYKRAVQSNPNFAEAVCGLSTALNSVCDWRGRGGVYLKRGAYDRWHTDADGRLLDSRLTKSTQGLMKQVVAIVSKQLEDSSHWGVGLLRGDVLSQLGQQLKAAAPGGADSGLDVPVKLAAWTDTPWEGSRIVRAVERATKVAMRRWYIDKYTLGRESRTGYPRPRLPSALSVPAAPTVLPFHTFTSPLSAKEIRMISQRNAARISCSTLRSSWISGSVYPPPPPPAPHLNVGYVSSDFNNHPLAHLMQSVFGFHDHRRVKAFCYATTPSDQSVHRRQIEQEAPVFYDASNWSAEKLVGQIVKDQIHILINLNGYTRGARNEIFAARPAPIQMSFMGFAGTLGAEWCDYILADETSIPLSTLRPTRDNLNLTDVFKDEEESQYEDWMYSENIIFCRDSFFCCDHAQSSEQGERHISWEDEQRRRWQMRKQLFPNISDDTIILGNFNQLYKIDPTTFRTWLRILQGVPKAILWLLRFPQLGEENLLRTARQWASEEVASRIRFTDVAPKQQHISRARVCDLFLDTPECNAHTTSADVLWSSTPLLTLPRDPYKMCSRMAASILNGALPKTAAGREAASDLIAESDDDYETLAVRLAGGLSYLPSNGQYCEGRGRLAEIRKLLFESKWTCGLFNTRRWVNDLEDAYQEAWRRWVSGEGGDIYLEHVS